mmetsp:Transcript_5264/g.12606  ORF Transcript_5264/g.12606 Transcript_5264/m.12606 type:complete len:977 (+) Transcript_5264:200-3130(+)
MGAASCHVGCPCGQDYSAEGIDPALAIITDGPLSHTQASPPTFGLQLSDKIEVQATASASGSLPIHSLVYVERAPAGNVRDWNSAASTTDGSSWKSATSSKAKARTISMVQTTGLGVIACPAEKLDKEKLAVFQARLQNSGIDIKAWGVGGAKSIEHLFWETYEQKGCIIIGKGSQVKRVTRLIKVKLVAEIFGVDHTLLSRMQFLHDGQTVERRQVPLRKLGWNKPGEEIDVDDPLLLDENCPYTEEWKKACSKALEDRLGLTHAWQTQHLIEDSDAYNFVVEDNVKSDGYPGLNTMYCIHEITMRVREPEHIGVKLIGLPEGQEFATAEGDFNFNPQQDDNGLPIGTQLNIWTWDRQLNLAAIASMRSGPSKVKSAATDKKKEAAASAATAAAASPAKPKESTARLIQRVPLPTACAKLMADMKSRLESDTKKRPPNHTLSACMESVKTDWSKAKKMASKISDPKYTLKDFNSDLAAFPELNLYLLDEASLDLVAAGGGSSSGRTMGDEFQRTMGAFYAIYWLMRLDTDGKDGFANGVDEDWVPVKVTGPEDLRVTQVDKRINFKKNAQWDFFHKLLMDAGLIVEKKERGLFKSQAKLQVCEKRLVSLLALTAMHDIMKMSMILPEVQKQHAPFHGYAAGDTVGDHDHALSYIMEQYPDLLPSFRGLEEAERRSVHFTQCNLSFNHGWFVQAEAPPGAIFTKFREALIKDQKSKIGRSDVALYFVHWLTDLAGAEPSPLAGCEKFVTKFPLPVLNSFLRSFEFVERIATESESEVMEEYLQMRWMENDPPLGALPSGESAIAQMRLLCMAQMTAPAVLRAFGTLTQEDKDTLNLEMSRTGCDEQSFSQHLVPSNTMEGPAFLVYYGPAFLQNLGNDSAVMRLSVLAEIYRCARDLWPPVAAKAAVNVTIRIDVIKALSTTDLVEVVTKGDVWMLVKHNDAEAFIERSTKRKLNKMIAAQQSFQVLDLNCLRAYS